MIKSRMIRLWLAGSTQAFLLFILGFVCTAPALGQADTFQVFAPTFLADQEIDSRAIAATQNLCLVPGDEVWLVSTRNNNGCHPMLPEQLDVVSLQNGCWSPSAFEELSDASTPDGMQTVVFAHGNMTNISWSIVRGCEVYGNLFSHANRPALRFVIWSWPSEREVIALGKDTSIKSRRAVEEGKTLRAALDRFQVEHTPILIGYSFGAQLVVSALEENTPENIGPRFRSALIAPAFDRDFIHRCEWCDLDRSLEILLAFVNSKDRVIKANGKFCARGHRGTEKCDHRVSTKLNCGNILEFDVTCEATSKHAISLYSQIDTIVAEVNGLLWGNLDAHAGEAENLAE